MRDQWRLHFFAVMSIVCLALLVLSGVCSAQITSLPEEGKAAAVCISPESGRWMVLERDFMPVEFEQHDLADGGSIVTWQGDPGMVFGAVFWPDDPKSPGVTRRVVLSGAPPKPPPPPEPDKTFGERLKPPADPATAKELVANYRQILSLWQAAPTVTDAITGGNPSWETFRQTMRTITGPADLQAAITVLEGVK